MSVLSISLMLIFSACEKVDTPPDGGDPQNATGWYGDDDMAVVPTTTNYGFGSDDLPSSVNLVPKFPPIGNQNPYGTCVAWAVAYNAKTAVNGMANAYSTSELSSSSKQFSPKDIFTALDDNVKGNDCNGTNFTTALDLLLSRGVATLSTVPYENLGDCSQSGLEQSWTNEANQHKIKYYRRIEKSIVTIRKNLANNVPIVLGAKLSDAFMSWNSDNVMSANTTYDGVGMHSYHALVIAGYDDNRGPNGAFKVINSWSTNWGDFGYIWIDYNFMVDEFCANLNGGDALFIMANEDGNNTPPDDPDPNVSGVDLIPWVFSDVSVDDWYAERQIEFNIYNVGNQTASPSANWSYVYIYYNAYDASDYGLIFIDQFNTSIAANTYECPTDYNCIINFPITSGNGFAETVWGTESLYRNYYMPDITGAYYLLLVADAEDVFQEQNELNNLFYTTNPDPAWFVNGVALKSEKSNNQVMQFKNDIEFDVNTTKSTRFNTAVNTANINAYTPEEIINFVKEKKKSGELEKSVATYLEQSSKMHEK